MKWLPSFDDEPENLGRAMWLEERELELQTAAVTRGISKALSGK